MATAYRNVSEADFESEVLKRSHTVPVVVDFWAEWCAPCRALGPVLERLASEAEGAWELAKVDVDQNQALARNFGVQGIPAVRAFKDGKQVAEFTGALPEEQVKEWLTGLGPSQADKIVDEAARAEAAGDLESAESLFEQALSLEPAHGEAASGLARTRLTLRQSQLDETTVSQKLSDNPSDLEALLAMADIEVGRDDHKAAFERLIDFIKNAAGDEREAARQHLLGLLDTLPADDPRVLGARRSLAAAIF